MPRRVRPYLFAHDGCATAWDECPLVDPVAVRHEGATLTVCMERTQYEAQAEFAAEWGQGVIA